MALTKRKVASFICGDRRTVMIDVTFDNGYRTGGLALTARDFGLTYGLTSIHAAAPTTGQVCPYDYANSKLMAFRGGAEVADGTDLSTVVTRVTAIGRGPGL